MMHLGKIHISHLAKYVVSVHELCVPMTLSCMLIKYNDMIYYKNKFMPEK